MMSSKHYIGLTDQEVLKSRELNGSNELEAPESDPAWKEFLLKFTGPFGHLFKKKVGPNAGEEYEDGDPLIFVLEIAAVLSFLVSCSQYYGWLGIKQARNGEPPKWYKEGLKRAEESYTTDQEPENNEEPLKRIFKGQADTLLGCLQAETAVGTGTEEAAGYWEWVGTDYQGSLFAYTPYPANRS